MNALHEHEEKHDRVVAKRAVLQKEYVSISNDAKTEKNLENMNFSLNNQPIENKDSLVLINPVIIS